MNMLTSTGKRENLFQEHFMVAAFFLFTINLNTKILKNISSIKIIKIWLIWHFLIIFSFQFFTIFLIIETLNMSYLLFMARVRTA